MKYVLFFLLLFSQSYGQLTAFTVDVTPTPETCPSNGSISIVVNNQTAGSNITFFIYELPNTTTPVDQFSTLTRGTLTAGNYRLTAVQTLGNEQNSASEDFTILQQLTELDFSIAQSVASNCNTNAGVLTVNVASGNPPYLFDIISGPIIFPQQTSNVFSGLPSGEFLVRVTDQCGSDVFEYTLTLPLNQISIGLNTLPLTINSCTSTTSTNALTASNGTTLIYPLTATYTINYPTGTVVVSTVIPNGPLDLLELSRDFELFPGVTYTYDLQIVDSCNTTFNSNGNEISFAPSVALSGEPNECSQDNLILSVSNVSPPYFVNFTTAPATFVPTDFVATYPGPFTETTITFGSETDLPPPGIYEVSISDACGRTATAQYEIIEEEIEPETRASNANCNTGTGTIRISLPQNREIVQATMVAAPAAYPNPVPLDVTGNIVASSGDLVITNLPVGTYDFTLVDNCGTIYDATDVTDATIQPYQPLALNASTAASCTSGFGSVRVRSGNDALTSLQIIAAPAAYPVPLPANVSTFLTSGTAFIPTLPAGNYVFEGLDVCGVQQTLAVTIVGYISGTNNYNYEQNCGSFNLTVNDTGSILGNSYWWQRFNPTEQVWEHPLTGENYPENTDPNETNSIALSNGQTLLNQSIIGTFRIIKVYQSFNNGNANCYEIFEPFTFSGDLEVVSALNIDCSGSASNKDVLIQVNGVPPYDFRILAIDGVPSVLENGNNNIFENLTNAIYDFEIEDSCGRRIFYSVNVNTIQAVAVANSPANPDILECVTENQTIASFDLTQLQQEILGNQQIGPYQINYFVDPGQRDSNTNRIENPSSFQNTTNPQIIYVRVDNLAVDICYGRTQFTLWVGENPTLQPQPAQILCENGDDVFLFGENGFDSYLWSTGSTAQFIRVDEAGTYTLTCRNNYGSQFCESTIEYVVTASSSPTDLTIVTSDWTENQNSITAVASGNGTYEYSINGGPFQNNGNFTDLTPGVYSITAADVFGCGDLSRDVVLLNYPKFFTPNGDGFNDTWQIKNAVFEPGIEIIIFDRYGKILTSLQSDSEGWDGTYNGQNMFSDDYWFRVIRADKRIHLGHFTLKR
ncbi:T9SS type B sorting domain-containing protein [Flavobacterium aurantiibacter]|uniref:T9SS type B sorting domain-containing protein n=1 Tax=Flavobacterium aurantiibacter TaxID=2023067 RepID=A0A255ZUF9_9FLAO|nr:T9SS type B sorting domain-containing protein [Flavobacterium aurantiibacter]OYQ44400.1 hypothetical protein CHX27_07555 [Flavobacterium aurantiibacter]